MARTRTHEIHLRLNEQEYRALTRNAKKCGLSQQAYLRMMCLNKQPTERPPMELIDILRNVQQINNNMNQIAVKANATGIVDGMAYWKNVSWLKEVVSLLITELNK